MFTDGIRVDDTPTNISTSTALNFASLGASNRFYLVNKSEHRLWLIGQTSETAPDADAEATLNERFCLEPWEKVLFSNNINTNLFAYYPKGQSGIVSYMYGPK